jgi:hypothetical protein
VRDVTVGKKVSELFATDPTLALLANLGGNSANVHTVTAATYDLAASDNGKLLVLSGVAPTAITVNADIVTAGFVCTVIDLIGSSTVAVGAGPTLVAPSGHTGAAAGAVFYILGPVTNTVVVSGALV